MIPVIDLGRAAVVAAKIVAFGGIVIYINSKSQPIFGILNDFKERAFSGFQSLSTVDMGCVSSLIGLDVALKSVLDFAFSSATVYVSAVATVLAFKLTAWTISLAMRV